MTSLSGESWEWGEYNYVRLDPHVEPAHILSIRRYASVSFNPQNPSQHFSPKARSS